MMGSPRLRPTQRGTIPLTAQRRDATRAKIDCASSVEVSRIMWAALSLEVVGIVRAKTYPHLIPLSASGYHVSGDLVFVAEYECRSILRRPYDMW